MRDAHQTKSAWNEVAAPSFSVLTKDTTVDVCVIGGGILGCTTAYLLALEGKQVMLLESRDIGSGETGRTTAHLTAVLDDRFEWLTKIHGEKHVRLAVESQLSAIHRIEQIVKKEQIDCHFERVEGFLFQADDEKEHIDLNAELAAAHQAGLTDAEKILRAPLADFDTGPCLSFKQQAQFHPLKYVYGIARALESLGAHVHTHTHVKNVEDTESGVLIETADGKKVYATAAVIATNAPIIDNAIIYSNQAPYRTYAIGAEIPRHSIPHALFWDTEEPYHYVRVETLSSDEDEEYELLIVGGEDHKTGQADDGEKRFKLLETWAQKHFPEMEKVLYRWSGQVMEPTDGFPLIGKKPGSEHIYIGTGDSGMGMTNSTAAAMLLTDLLTGRENPWSAIYDPLRFSIKASKEFVKENLNVAKTMITDFVKPAEVSSADEVKKGEAALMGHGTKRIALYRDDAGKMHSLSAICPHKGCTVHWNSLEKSWDCPCHGSRFDTAGQVLNGPSIAPLEKEVL